MINYPSYVKNKLTGIIKEMAASPELFVKNPGLDFIRNRKLTFESVVQLLLSMGGNSIYKELLDYFEYDTETASSSGFIQQRDKILPIALEFLLNEFTNSFNDYKTYNGYRLLAVDGSDLNITYKLTKHGYQVNFTIAIQICKYFFRCLKHVRPPDVEALIKKNVLLVRKGRKDPRKIRPKTTVSFNYRVA